MVGWRVARKHEQRFLPRRERRVAARIPSAVARGDHEQGRFADDTERARVTDVYHDAIAEFERRLLRACAVSPAEN